MSRIWTAVLSNILETVKGVAEGDELRRAISDVLRATRGQSLWSLAQLQAVLTALALARPDPAYHKGLALVAFSVGLRPDKGGELCERITNDLAQVPWWASGE